MEAATSPDNRKLLSLGLHLDQPLSDIYNPETVDFPNSPSGLKNRPQEIMEPEAAPQAAQLPADEDTEYAAGSDAEEYFEDLYSPLTYENSLSTRRSFIRKVKSAAVRVPDADRIEGIVKSGNLIRHGSIRRKIVPLTEDLTKSPDSFTEDCERVHSEIPATSTPLTDHTENFTAALETPIVNTVEAELDKSLGELGRLDEETILRIRDCLDAGKMKDIYTLGSRLQDLLSPTEIEEILNNSQRYTDVFGEDVVLALSGSTPQIQPKKLLSAPKFNFESTTSSDPSDTPTNLKKREPTMLVWMPFTMMN